MEINRDTLSGLISKYRDDREMIGTIADALGSFEEYHRAIYTMELQRKLYAGGAVDPDTWRETLPALDKTRRYCHNTLLANVNILNRIAAMADLPPFYGGTVSEERPHRRDVADAVLRFVREVITERE